MRKLIFGLPLTMILAINANAASKSVDHSAKPKVKPVLSYKLPSPPSYYNSTTDIKHLNQTQLVEVAKYQIAYYTVLKTLSNESENQKNADEQIALWQKALNR